MVKTNEAAQATAVKNVDRLVNENETNEVVNSITDKLSPGEKIDKEAFEALLKQEGKSKAQFIFDCICINISDLTNF